MRPGFFKSMATLSQMLARFEKTDILLAAQVAMELTADAAEDQQRQQLSQGLRGDDTVMPDYSPTSVKVFGKPEGPIKLYDQGDFYKGIQLSVRGDIFNITSTDMKTTMLENHYGIDILRLGTQAKINYIRVLRPEYVNTIRNDLKI